MRRLAHRLSALQGNSSGLEPIQRALGYPYPRPRSSFVFDVDSGTALPFACKTWRGLEALQSLQVNAAGLTLAEALPAATLNYKNADFTPVLALGSNAAPSQLARKFTREHCPAGSIVPTLAGTLKGFDCVYAPLVSSYGSVTATLEPSDNTEVEVFATFLTPALLKRMHETEGGYNFYRLEKVELTLAAGHYRATDVLCYVHQVGSLCLGGDPVALKEIAATNRRFLSKTQQEIQVMVCEELEGEHCGKSLDAWVQSNLNDETARLIRVKQLIKLARPFAYEHACALQQLGDMHSRNVK